MFIIGGGTINDSLRKQILYNGAWKKGDLVAIITLASSWDSSYHWSNEEFKKFTGVDALRIDSAALGNRARLDSLEKAKIIFLGGGDQSRFMRLIEGTPVKSIIQKIYRNGGLIAGTSAGAAVMSKKMITGNSLRDTAYSSTFDGVWKGNLELKDGLGLLDSVIIDQHFLARSRHNRLLTAVLDYPSYQCIGIDESTAIVVKNGMATVVGESQVIIFSDPKKIRTTNPGLIAGTDISVSLFLPGEKFRIKK